MPLGELLVLSLGFCQDFFHIFLGLPSVFAHQAKQTKLLPQPIAQLRGGLTMGLSCWSYEYRQGEVTEFPQRLFSPFIFARPWKAPAFPRPESWQENSFL